MLVSKTNSLKVTYVPEKNVVRWDTDAEYGFDKIPEWTGSLAHTLLRRLRK
jgi:hypothetical protein